MVGSGTVKLEVYKLGESLSVEGGSSIGSFNGRLDGNEGG